jgi:hypothetical protein
MTGDRGKEPLMRKGEGGIRKVDWKGMGHSVKIEHSEISDKSNAMPYAL